MIISQRGTTTVAASVNQLADTSLQITTPTGVVAGDTLIAFINTSGNAGGGSVPTISAPDGTWTQITNASGSNSGGNYEQTVWTKNLTAAPAANYTWTTGTGCDLTGQLIAFQGKVYIDQSSRIDNNSVPTPVLAPSIDVLTNTDWLLCCFVTDSGGATWATPSGMTNQGGDVQSVGNFVSSHLFSEALTTVGLTGSESSTCTSPGSNAGANSITIRTSNIPAFKIGLRPRTFSPGLAR